MGDLLTPTENGFRDTGGNQIGLDTLDLKLVLTTEYPTSNSGMSPGPTERAEDEAMRTLRAFTLDYAYISRTRGGGGSGSEHWLVTTHYYSRKQ